METEKAKLERKLKEAREKLARTDGDYEELLKMQKERERLTRRVENLTKLLSEL